MSKLAHSNEETMQDIELDHLVREDEINIEFVDRNLGLYWHSCYEKLHGALKEGRGTSLRYVEVRALMKLLLQMSDAA